MPDSVAAAVPVLVTVTVCAALVVLTVWPANESELGLVPRTAVGVTVPLGNTCSSET